MSPLPRHVAICGAPTAGKDEVAKVLQAEFGYQHIDTGRTLRDMCKVAYGLSEDDVATQEGKLRLRRVLGQDYPHRKLIGDMGVAIERFYGTHWVAERAVEAAEAAHGGEDITGFVYSGCRLDQGRFYRAMGGLVLEVIRPGVYIYHDFDQYDRSQVHATISNHGTLAELRAAVIRQMEAVREHGIPAISPPSDAIFAPGAFA